MYTGKRKNNNKIQLWKKKQTYDKRNTNTESRKLYT